jgi:hypothetical protein
VDNQNSHIHKNLKTLYVDGKPVGQVEATGDTMKDMEIARRFLRESGFEREVTIFQAMYRQALSFASAANYVYVNDLNKTPVNPLGIAPFVVNSAFSIEVYLKTIHQLSGKSVKGHKLRAIYDSIPIEWQSKIHDAAKRFSIEFNIKDFNEFPNYIKELDDAFVEWRYLYEKERTSEVKILPTIYVMKVLHEVCRETGKT